MRSILSEVTREGFQGAFEADLNDVQMVKRRKFWEGDKTRSRGKKKQKFSIQERVSIDVAGI